MAARGCLAVLLSLVYLQISLGEYYHKVSRSSVEASTPASNVKELEASWWAAEAQAGIAERLRRRLNTQPARNVVLFLGDGMSVPTLAAARAHLGQRFGRTGEEERLAFETFPTVGLAKTYCVDAQIADSACTATAYLCGSKANRGTIGVSGRVKRFDCDGAANATHHVESIATWALADGRDAGIVTTTRVTHASPAGAYAHTGNRDWESDADLAQSCAQPQQTDIAMQLINTYPGNHFKVILGGGRREFLPNTTIDEEGTRGRRLDGRDLIKEWKADKADRGLSHEYVWNREQLMEFRNSQKMPEYLLGLFEGSHMEYHLDGNPETEPTLAELTEVAIKSLSRNKRGFFLFVEGGRIDHAHHENQARRALDETVELSAAVARAARLLHPRDSLLVVTSDHAHVMTLNGYTHRGGDILGPSDDIGDDNVPYMTLSYTNGPGFRPHADYSVRQDVTKMNYEEHDFAYPAEVPLASETHGGDDVAVFARGPYEHLFSGVFEQSQIPHIMAYAACIGPGMRACRHQYTNISLRP